MKIKDKVDMKDKANVSGKRSIRVITFIGLAFLNVILLGIVIYMFIQTGGTVAASARETYESKKTEVAESTAQMFYDVAFQTAEKEYHVSNRVFISIGDIQEQSKLEVLKVSDVELILNDAKEDKDKYWVSIPGNGLYTVDMKESEFLIDEIRHAVIVRLPMPCLTECSVDSEDIEYHWLENRKSSNGSYAQGVAYAENDFKDGERKIREFLSNQEYLANAKISAELLITEIIHNLNPEIKDLEVIVEFME